MKDNETQMGTKKLYEQLLKAAGKPLVYDTIVEQILKKYGSDEKFIDAVHKVTGIPEDTIVKEITDAATTPVQEQKANNKTLQDRVTNDPDGPIQQTNSQEKPMVPSPQTAPGLGGTTPNMQPPQQMQAAAANNQAKGMSPGQALNVANQQQNTPAMKKGGLITKPKEQEGGLTDLEKANRKMERGGSVDGGLNPQAKIDRIEAQDGGDMGEMDLMGKHRPGMLSGGLMSMPNYNNSVEMADGGSNEPPAGALPEEVADDQPVMLSKGEFVMPANVVRYLGLETLMALRDKALKGLAAMEAGGQIRRSGDNKNPGEEGEVEPRPILGGKTTKQIIKESDAVELLEHHAIESIEEHAELLEQVENMEHDEDDMYMKSGGDLSSAPEGSTLALKTAHLKHTSNYGYKSGLKQPNNLNNSPPAGGGPALKKGGLIPPDNTTGIDPSPTAFKDSKGGKPMAIGGNLGKKRPFRNSKAQSGLNGKGQIQRMAAGGDVSMEQAGKYLNEQDNDSESDKSERRDSLPDYESAGDWIDAVSRSPNFGVGSIFDAINGRGFFAKEDPAYVTVGERRAGLGSDELANTLEANAPSKEAQAASQEANERNAGERNTGLDNGPQVDIGIDQ